MRIQQAATISNQDQLNKNLTRILNANITAGNPLTYSAIDGSPLTFNQDNISGIIIRIGSNANPNGLPASWPGNNVDLTIAHNMGRVPYGIIVIAKWASTDVFFGSIAPTDMNVTLQTTNDATDTTILLLAPAGN